MVREFNFKSTIEQFKISGEIFEVDFSDEKLKLYQEKFNEFLYESSQVENLRNDKMSEQEQEEYFNKSYDLCKKMIDTILGDGSFDKLYQLSGRSIFNMIDVIEFLSEAISDKTVHLRENNREKYLKKAKKKKAK